MSEEDRADRLRRVQPWEQSPDEQPRDPWEEPPPGGRRREPDDYDQPTGFMRRPEPVTGVPGEYPTPTVYGQPAPGGYPEPTVYGQPSSTGTYPQPATPSSYPEPTVPGGYPTPAAPGGYPTPAAPDAYPTPAVYGQPASPAQTGSYPQPAARGTYPEPASGSYPQASAPGGYPEPAPAGGYPTPAVYGQPASPAQTGSYPQPAGYQEPGVYGQPAGRATPPEPAEPASYGPPSGQTGAWAQQEPAVYGQPSGPSATGSYPQPSGYPQPSPSGSYPQSPVPGGYPEPAAQGGYAEPSAPGGYPAPSAPGYPEPAAPGGYPEPAASGGYAEPSAPGSYPEPATNVYGHPAPDQPGNYAPAPDHPGGHPVQPDPATPGVYGRAVAQSSATGGFPQVPAAYAEPDPRVYGRPAEPDGRQPHYDEPTWASASLGLPASEQVRIPPPPRRRRRREWNDEQAWQEPVRQDPWAEQRRHDEWLDVPHGGRRFDEPRARRGQQIPPPPPAPAPAQEYDSAERPLVDDAPRMRRADERSDRATWRQENEISTPRSPKTKKILLGAGLCVLLLVAGLGYWFYGPQGNGVETDTYIPGATVPGVMAKVKGEGFTCLAPGATVARCTKAVSGVEFSVTLQFLDENRVTAIMANGGTGTQSQVAVTDKELKPFFAMASQLPFTAPSADAKAWVDKNVKKDAKSSFSGVMFETANGQDILNMYTKKPV
ncbi:hypothetical protein Lfu02_67360 [Longispora fulva]|nr:hypothetical protein Lfu02_67360 [Longispora fulva]